MEAQERANLDRLSAEIRSLDAAAGRLSLARVAGFGILVAGAIGAAGGNGAWAVLALAGMAGFTGTFFLHWRTLDRRLALQRERVLLDERLCRRATRRRARPAPRVPPGACALEEGRRLHAPEPETWPIDAGAADDLSLLGGREALDTSSVFGFLDWSSTPLGSRRLRHVLLNPLRHKADILQRQEAVREIAEREATRRLIQEALLPLRNRDIEAAIPVFTERFLLGHRRALLAWSHVAGTAAPLCLAWLAVSGNLALLSLLVPLLAINIVTIGWHVSTTNRERDRLLLLAPVVDGVLGLGESLGSVDWSAEWARIAVTVGEVRAPARRLRRRLSLLALHEYGIFFEIVNFLTLWELRVLPLAVSVFEEVRASLERAAGALGEAEALICLSLPLAEQPDFEMPQVLDGHRPRIEADALGHPLLHPSVSVRNRIALGDPVRVILVTGSNMAGKSTYLKAAAANVILAGTGGPVCAQAFRWTPVALRTDVNVRDSLDDGKSYFLVEVERVREAVYAAKENPFVLAIFDELFRGTNSVERLALARAILRWLRNTGALCLVATHDQALTRLITEDAEPGMGNRHFEESVEEGEMRFDYRLRDGPAVTRNAIRLVEVSRFPPEIVREARETAT